MVTHIGNQFDEGPTAHGSPIALSAGNIRTESGLKMEYFEVPGAARVRAKGAGL